jgi:hypothetical protein
MTKLWNALGNGLWQFIPSVFTLLLSFSIVRLYSTAMWGNVVSLLVIQQIVNSVLAWGNKDFLQRELAVNISQFNTGFSTLLKERFFIFVLALPCLFFSGWISKDLFIPFVLLVFGKFLQQSFDVIILKERKFTLAVTLELVFMVAQVIALVVMRHAGCDKITDLLLVFWVPALAKGIVLSLVFRNYFVVGKIKDIVLAKAFFFGMLSVSGLIHSKIDIVLASKFLNLENLGKYQIIMAFLWNIQSVAIYISSPYIHNFYRLNKASQYNSALFLRKIGSLIVPVGVFAMMILLYYGFHISMDSSMIAASLVFSAMSFIYLPWIFKLNQYKKESRVLSINLLGTLALVTFIVTADKICGLTLERMLWILSIQQLFITIVTYACSKKIKTCPQP